MIHSFYVHHSYSGIKYFTMLFVFSNDIKIVESTKIFKMNFIYVQKCRTGICSLLRYNGKWWYFSNQCSFFFCLTKKSCKILDAEKLHWSDFRMKVEPLKILNSVISVHPEPTKLFKSSSDKLVPKFLLVDGSHNQKLKGTTVKALVSRHLLGQKKVSLTWAGRLQEWCWYAAIRDVRVRWLIMGAFPATTGNAKQNYLVVLGYTVVLTTL